MTRASAALTRSGVMRVAALGIAGVACLAADHAVRLRHPRSTLSASSIARDGHVLQYWPSGAVKVDATYRDDVYEGEYRTFYESGRRYEVRHYVGGHEQGPQQSWTETGVLYLNYEVQEGRRYGMVNATPCNTVGDRTGTGSAGRDDARPGTSEGAVVSDTDAARRSGVRADALAVQADVSSEGSARASRSGGDGHVAVGSDAHEPSRLPFYADATFLPHWTPVAHRVSPFRLRTQTGTPISDADLRGGPYVASFIYTQCAAVCPVLVAQLARVQRTVGADHARIVSFSVTPDADTPDTLAQFARERGIDARSWSLVTGSKHAIYTLARDSYFADDTRIGLSVGDVTAFLHTEKLVLVDGSGHLRGVYNGTQPFAVDQLISDLRQLNAVRTESD